jgi:hypothetical protein
MYANYDGQLDEAVARGGTFDITGTTIVVDKQYFGFDASDGAILNSIKGIPLNTKVTTLAEIRASEVDVSGFFLTAVSDPLLGKFYRVDGYVITSIKLTSGTLHCYKTKDQISA